ncbi:hypothetical protein ETD83_01190 [Actinomadura soli]|uniref:HEAT repeat domain-containing protein n=1 Tax=Actinomadura soli TaxID=2508997 RepID=A0A5C4JKP0_9ACTN|nr:hypothetical protein [Actinomadura soli]TMR07242.1 hypothetical protein ETD83_01190 [Actinomadura soli]
MRYESVPPVSRDDLRLALAEKDNEAIHRALVGLALHDADGAWVQDQCLALKDHPSWDVRAIALLCLGHVARIHGTIDLDRVLPVLRSALNDPRTAGYAEQAIDDIEVFVTPDQGPHT